MICRSVSKDGTLTKYKGEGTARIKEGNFRLCSNRKHYCSILPYVMQSAESFFKDNSHTASQELFHLTPEGSILC
jgi:hypothetical protein